MSAEPPSNRPRYTALAPCPGARSHLFVADREAVPEIAFAPGISLSDFPERWHVAAHALVLPEPLGGAGPQLFRSADHLIALLRHRLGAETMGLRLYVVGREPFVWDVARVAQDAGMGRDEMYLFAVGEPERRVFCVHCRTLNPGVSTTLVPCAGCGVMLEVRHHFSRVQNAWLGVQCDAEAPGEIPALEKLPA
jgi:dimethylamine monooxygenase subunit C